MRTYRFRVTMKAEASQADMLEYIRDAIRGWGGSHHPEDPFFGDNKEIEVVPVHRLGEATEQ